MTNIGSAEVEFLEEQNHRLLLRSSILGVSPSVVVHWFCPTSDTTTPVHGVHFERGESALSAIVRTAQHALDCHYVDAPNCRGERPAAPPFIARLDADEAVRVREELEDLDLRG
jgi:hypothetical protein